MFWQRSVRIAHTRGIRWASFTLCFGGGEDAAAPFWQHWTSLSLPFFNNAVLHHEQVPKRAALRKSWTTSLVDSVSKANLIFLDPDNGIQGRRLTPKHVALAEIAALRRQERALVTVQHQSGQKLEVKSIAERLKSIGCQRLES